MRYFHNVLDLEQYTEMNDLFSPYVVMHRPEGDLTYLDVIQTAFQRGLAPHSMETTIHEIVASGDYVSVRLTHKLTYSSDQAFMHSRLGQFDVRGKIVKWDAMAMFRFKDGKIIEEWVSPDELGQLLQIGKLEFSAKQ
jgi:predicted ester cyclase